MSLSRRIAAVVLPSLLGVALMAGLAHADVAPPNDAGSGQDLSSTMAKPDMSTPTTTEDGGCSMSGHGSGSAASLVAVSAVALALLARRRRTA
jgi:MYXO-CTERM domain-containing protein